MFRVSGGDLGGAAGIWRVPSSNPAGPDEELTML